jgi:hypothetical protein
MAICEEEIAEILRVVHDTGLIYMMGEASFYNPATVFAREKQRKHLCPSMRRLSSMYHRRSVMRSCRATPPFMMSNGSRLSITEHRMAVRVAIAS